MQSGINRYQQGRTTTMVNYRRSRIQGGTYFFTVNLYDRSSNHLVTHINHLRRAFRTVQKQRPFEIVASVILPEHLHIIITLPDDDCNFPERWKAIKSQFTRALVQDNIVCLTKNKKGEYNLWQRRYWEHQIRDEVDLQHHVDYIHYNPVKHGHVRQVVDWPYSSFHRYVKSGVIESNWGGGDKLDGIGGYGE